MLRNGQGAGEHEASASRTSGHRPLKVGFGPKKPVKFYPYIHFVLYICVGIVDFTNVEKNPIRGLCFHIIYET